MKFIGTFFDLCKKLIKNGGMESVTSLPTTNNFEGREVNYKGTKYIYYNGDWVNQRDAEKLGGLDSSLYITKPKETVIGESNHKIYGETQTPSENYIDTFHSPLIYASPDNFTIEYSDDGEIFTEIEKTDPIYNIRFYNNSSYYLKFTTHPYYRITVPYNGTVPIRGTFYALVLQGWNYYIDRCLIEELQGEVWNVIADEQENRYIQTYYAVEFKSHYLFFSTNSSYCQSIRVTLQGRHYNNKTSYGVSGIALLCNYYRDLSGIRNYFKLANGILSTPLSFTSQETLNYDINNIKPTQTGEVKKSSSWIWQYLVQSVNWLRDNMVLKTHTHNGTDAERIDYANLKNKPDIPEAITVDSALSATSTNPVQNKKVYAALQDKADLVASAYNYTNGYLVKTDIAASVEGPIYIHIYGLSRYNASPINTEIALYNTSSGITQSYGIHYGMNFGNIHVFHYNDYVYFWFAQSQTYQVFYFEVYTSGTNATTNHIIGYANGAKPTSGTTHEITVIPIQVSYNNHSHDGTGTPKIDYNDLENKPTIYTSATINGVNVDFSADNNNIPSYITFDTVLYPFRFTGTAFQIYRNDVWVDILNIGNLLTDGSGVITTDNVDWWFDPTIREYYIEQSVIVSLLTKKFPLGKPTTIDWSNVVINTGGLSISLTGGKSTALIAQLKENLSNVFGGEGFNFYTEYDIAAMIDSGVGFKLKIELNRYTDSNGNNVNDVIVECYQIWR